jgi:hypothetical protein
MIRSFFSEKLSDLKNAHKRCQGVHQSVYVCTDHNVYGPGAIQGEGGRGLESLSEFSGIVQWNDLNLTYVVIFARIFFIFRTICPNFHSYFNWVFFLGGGLPPLSYGYACMCTIIAISYTTRATSNQLSAMPKLQGRLYELYFTHNMYSLANRCA